MSSLTLEAVSATQKYLYEPNQCLSDPSIVLEAGLSRLMDVIPGPPTVTRTPTWVLFRLPSEPPHKFVGTSVVTDFPPGLLSAAQNFDGWTPLLQGNVPVWSPIIFEVPLQDANGPVKDIERGGFDMTINPRKAGPVMRLIGPGDGTVFFHLGEFLGGIGDIDDTEEVQ
ncbi:hypothetical protein BV22DRAFT_234608 [Leucogyrophana mollusca]|uniref:Uncharacterized protein n=1 Tax=Leucogyrophana mollusca TaxID=85980 RepID=A0ACB8BRF9_9AGAM|nr:hypothetical protein BV22DRAFT_234608 [Leucogyrophana mollusca]